jgi:branched-subunit amino acid aminotransferase/4-amino-4-deoxychorismate lyase
MEKRRLNTSTSSLGYKEPTTEELAAIEIESTTQEGDNTPRGPNRAKRRQMTSMRTTGMSGEMKPWTPYERAKKRLKTTLGRKVNSLRLRMAKSHNR